jgi:hypothetical protein
MIFGREWVGFRRVWRRKWQWLVDKIYTVLFARSRAFEWCKKKFLQGRYVMSYGLFFPTIPTKKCLTNFMFLISVYTKNTLYLDQYSSESPDFLCIRFLISVRSFFTPTHCTLTTATLCSTDESTCYQH